MHHKDGFPPYWYVRGWFFNFINHTFHQDLDTPCPRNKDLIQVSSCPRVKVVKIFMLEIIIA